MNDYEEKLKAFLRGNHINGEHLHFDQSCHTVEEAAAAVGGTSSDFVKSICMIDEKGNLIVAIIKGEDRASTTKVGEVLHIPKPRIATPEEILAKTGYICGGTPAFGYSATFLIDTYVMEKDVVYTGGGSEQSLIRISPKEIHRVNEGQIVDIRRD